MAVPVLEWGQAATSVAASGAGAFNYDAALGAVENGQGVLVALVFMGSASGASITVTDNLGNSYAEVATPRRVSSGNYAVTQAVFWCPSIAGAPAPASLVVRVASSANLVGPFSDSFGVNALAVSGNSLSVHAQVSGTAGGSGASAINSPYLTPTVDGVLLAGFTTCDSNSSGTFTITGGYAKGSEVGDSSSWLGASAHLAQATAAQTRFGFTYSSTPFYGSAMALLALHATDGGGTPAEAPGGTVAASAALTGGQGAGAAQRAGGLLATVAALLGGSGKGAAAHAGTTMAASVALLAGMAAGAAGAGGQAVAAGAQLLPGAAVGAAAADGRVLPATGSLVAGTASARAAGHASGVTLAVAPALHAGIAGGGASAPGGMAAATADLIAGAASTGGSAGAAILAAGASITAGHATAAARAQGDTLAAAGVLLPGGAGEPPDADTAARIVIPPVAQAITIRAAAVRVRVPPRSTRIVIPESPHE